MRAKQNAVAVATRVHVHVTMASVVKPVPITAKEITAKEITVSSNLRVMADIAHGHNGIRRRMAKAGTNSVAVVKGVLVKGVPVKDVVARAVAEMVAVAIIAASGCRAGCVKVFRRKALTSPITTVAKPRRISPRR